MKKALILWLTLQILFLATSMVSAEKYDWVDKAYDFSQVKRVWVEDIVLTDTAEFESPLLSKILQDDYQKNADRLKEKRFTKEFADKLFTDDPKSIADIYVKAELTKWHDDYYIKPAYTSWESRRSTRKVKRSDGKEYEEVYYTEVPVYHPEETIYTSTVQIRFDVYDAKTGTKIMSRDELRLRDNSWKGEQGIFGRISKAFFDDLVKKLNEKH